MSATLLGTNCNVDAGILSPNIVLCAGEDVTELLRAFEGLGEEPRRCHSYRCYRFWQYSRFTLIWTGIGTGCIEPLLFEILTQTPVVQTIILIGTAGKLRSDLDDQSHVITQARLGPAPFGDYRVEEPLTPEFDWQTQPALQGVPMATVVSTDLFYGFPQPYDAPGSDRADVGELRKRFESLCEHSHLIEMEVGQFYYLCRKLRKAGSLRFLAIKGPANALGAAQEQVAGSARVLRQCGETTIALLDLRQPGATAPPAPPTPAVRPAAALSASDPKQILEEEKHRFNLFNEEEKRKLEIEKMNFQKDIEAKKYDLDREKMWRGKLIEEVKIFWTMQVGIIAALSYIVSKFEKFDSTAVPFGCAALALVIMAAAYNYVGNYYTFVDRTNLGNSDQQEAVITPLVDWIHTLLAAGLGAIIGNGLGAFSPLHLPSSWYAWWPNFYFYVSLVVGAAAAFVFYSAVIWGVYRHLCRKNDRYSCYNRRWGRRRQKIF